MQYIVNNDLLPESLMGRLMTLQTGHTNSPDFNEEETLKKLIKKSVFLLT